LRFFLHLFLAVATGFSAALGTARRWKGRRLLGIDGMDVDLPQHPHVRRIFPTNRSTNGFVYAVECTRCERFATNLSDHASIPSSP
jgi:hypothetical protein